MARGAYGQVIWMHEILKTNDKGDQRHATELQHLQLATSVLYGQQRRLQTLTPSVFCYTFSALLPMSRHCLEHEYMYLQVVAWIRWLSRNES